MLALSFLSLTQPRQAAPFVEAAHRAYWVVKIVSIADTV